MSSIEELRGFETSLTDVPVPRRGVKGTIASPPSRTPTNKSLPPPGTFIHSIPPSSTQGQPPSQTRARGHSANANYTTPIPTGISAPGFATPSASEFPGPATTSQRTHIYGYKSHRVSSKVVIVIVCVLVAVLIVVVIGLFLWWKKRTVKKKRGRVYRMVPPVDTTEGTENVWPVGAADLNPRRFLPDKSLT